MSGLRRAEITLEIDCCGRRNTLPAAPRTGHSSRASFSWCGPSPPGRIYAMEPQPPSAARRLSASRKGTPGSSMAPFRPCPGPCRWTFGDNRPGCLATPHITAECEPEHFDGPWEHLARNSQPVDLWLVAH